MNERYIIMHSVYPNYLLFFKKKNKLFCIGETKDIVDLFGMNIVKTVNTIIVDNLNIIDKKEVLNNQYELLCTKVKMINF